MKLIGNIIWFLFGGLETAIVLFLYGLLCCVTIIGIPVGLQLFKMAKLMLAPFGKVVSGNFGAHPILNVIWFLFGGLWSAISFFFLGLGYCITIIGIPFGLQWFKMAKLILFPFGAKIESAAALKAAAAESTAA